MPIENYYTLVQGRFYSGDIEGKRYHWRERIPGSKQLMSDLENGRVVKFIYYRPLDVETGRGKYFYGSGMFDNETLKKRINPETNKNEFYCDIREYSDFSAPISVDSKLKKEIWPGANRHAGIKRIPEFIFKQIISQAENPGKLNSLAGLIGENNLEDLLNKRINVDDLKDYEGSRVAKRSIKTSAYKRTQALIRRLKTKYRGLCQITGEKLVSSIDFGTDVTEAHHLQYLCEGGMDGDPSNTIIISPEWHRLLHKKNPVFDRNKLIFVFEDGKELKIKFPGHLEHRGRNEKENKRTD